MKRILSHYSQLMDCHSERSEVTEPKATHGKSGTMHAGGHAAGFFPMLRMTGSGVINGFDYSIENRKSKIENS
jgi:hypothetical protein